LLAVIIVQFIYTVSPENVALKRMYIMVHEQEISANARETPDSISLISYAG